MHDHLENRLTIGGRIASEPATRVSPAGIPITRFVLEHQSRQSEAGHQREARCRITVIAAGDQWRDMLSQVGESSMVTVTGFLSHAGYRSEEKSLVLHAERVERLD